MAIEWRTKRFVSALARLHPRKGGPEAGRSSVGLHLRFSLPLSRHPTPSPNDRARRAY